MNSNPPNDDLLSAFHDREVTPGEETAAEARLRDWPQAKQELADFRRISEILRVLPRQSAPAEFASAVMQRAEREMLIPMAVAASPTAAYPFAKARGWWIGIALTAAVALVAVIAVPFVARKSKPAPEMAASGTKGRALQGNPSTPVAVNDAKDRMSAPHLDMRSTASMKAGANGTGSRGPQSLALIGTTRAMPAPPSSPSLRSPALLLAKRAESSPAAASSANAPGAKPSSQLTFPADLKTAKVGDVVEALEQIGQQVAVVRLTVVSHAEGLDGIENLLVRNTDRRVQNRADIITLRNRIQKMKQLGGEVSIHSDPSRDGVGDLICVFVEGTREQLLSVLQDVQNESHIRGARLTNTISPAQLTQFSNGTFTPAGQKPNRQPPRQVASLPASTVDKIVSQRESAKKWEIRAPTRKPIDDMAKREEPGMGGGMGGGIDSLNSDKLADKRQENGRMTATSPYSVARRTPVRDRAGAAHDVRHAEVASKHSYQVFFVLEDPKSGTGAGSSTARPSQREPVIAQHPHHHLPRVAATPASPRQPAPGQPAAPQPSAAEPAER